jgi:membrane-associated phospholipid phosphatase
MTATRGAGAPMSATITMRAHAIVENARNAIMLLLRAPPARAARLVPAAWRRHLVHGVIAAVTIALAMILVDQRAYQFASGLPPWLVDGFYAITDFGRSGWILVPTGGLILVIALLASPALDHMTRGVLAMLVVRIGFIFIAVGLPGLLVTIVKRWIGRVRPSAQGPFAYEPFSWRPEYASLPSGHTTTAFAALVAIGAIFPRARPFLWGYALLIALSRIVVTAHYSSDVIAGAAVGAFGALWVRDWFARRRLGFVVGTDGAVHALAGPSPNRIKRVARALIAP